MEKQETFIKDLFLIKNEQKSEIIIKYDKNLFFNEGLNMNFIQDNESLSKRNVLRGLHIQIQKPQGKLVSVLQGKIFDVAVDLRKKSETYMQWFGVELSSDNNTMFYIPEGFAHGFLVLSDIAKVSFKVSNYWDSNDEIGIPWDDPKLNIKWPLNKETPIIAEKDKKYKTIIENKIFNLKG